MVAITSHVSGNKLYHLNHIFTFLLWTGTTVIKLVASDQDGNPEFNKVSFTLSGDGKFLLLELIVC
jgi:hypothetical protein